jgi:hypothetical protein
VFWSSPISTRIIARIKALLADDWKSRAGAKFRDTTQSISDFAEEHHITPGELLSDGVDLGRRKLEGLASHEYAEALKNFAEEEKIRTEAELQRRSMEAELRKRNAEAKKTEAEARLAEINTIHAEIELLQKLNDIRVVLHRDSYGNLTALPVPPEVDLLQILDQKQIAAPPLQKGVSEEEDGIHIRGEVKGPFSYPTLRMIIEPEAQVYGDLRADLIVISANAAVYGNIEGLRHVEIKEGGKLTGDVKTARISIEDGAHFKGEIDIVK